MPVIILAGGFGTRLQSVLGNVPKPMAPVLGKPFLYFLIQSLYRQGIRKIYLSLYHQSKQIIEFIDKTPYPSDLRIECAIEPEPMGTGGALAFAYTTLIGHGPSFVVNGDTYLEGGIGEFSNKTTNTNYIGLVSINNTSRYGEVKMNSQDFVVSLREKNVLGKRGLINSGSYFLREETLRNIPLKPLSLEREIFPSIIEQKKLKGIPMNSIFIDIGVPDDYNAFLSMVKEQGVKDSWQ